MDSNVPERVFSLAPAAAVAYAASEPDRLHAHPARCESATGGPLGPGPSMVPGVDSFSTPPHPHAFPPGTCAYPTHGALPPAAHFAAVPPGALPVPPPAPLHPWPTPGGAYIPYVPHPAPYTPPAPPHQYDARDSAIAALTSQLQGAMNELARCSMMARN